MSTKNSGPAVGNTEEAPRVRVGKIGRPTVLDDTLADKLLELAETGASQRVICDAVGLSRSTLSSWLARGKAGEEPFSEFSARWKQAIAKGEIGLIQCVRDASSRSWQAAQFLLERRFRRRWAKPKDAP